MSKRDSQDSSCGALRLARPARRPGSGTELLRFLVSVVKDDQENVIPGATITLVNTGTGERREGVSADDGVYRFLNLVPALTA